MSPSVAAVTHQSFVQAEAATHNSASEVGNVQNGPESSSSNQDEDEAVANRTLAGLTYRRNNLIEVEAVQRLLEAEDNNVPLTFTEATTVELERMRQQYPGNRNDPRYPTSSDGLCLIAHRHKSQHLLKADDLQNQEIRAKLQSDVAETNPFGINFYDHKVRQELVHVNSIYRTEHSLAWGFPERKEPPSFLYSTVRCSSPDVQKGLLARLPVELLAIISEYVDFASLCKFRQTARFAYNCIQVSSLYHRLTVWASAPLSQLMLLAPESPVASRCCMADLYAKLTSPKCEVCSNVGAFYNVLANVRVCHPCLVSAPEFHVVDFQGLLDKDLEVTEQEWEALPWVRSLGVVDRAPPVSRRLYAVTELPRSYSICAARVAYLIRLRRTTPVKNRQYRLAVSCKLPAMSFPGKKPLGAVSCAGCHKVLENLTKRWTVSMKVWTALTKEYTDHQLADHIMSCLPAQELYREAIEAKARGKKAVLVPA